MLATLHGCDLEEGGAAFRPEYTASGAVRFLAVSDQEPGNEATLPPALEEGTMNGFLASCFAFTASAVLISGGTPARPPSGFRLRLEHTPNGWSARCDSGCNWQSASFTCRIECAALIDQNGVVTAATPRPEPTSFSFTVEWTGRGWTALGRTGTMWTSIGWACREAACQARVDASGVSAVSSLR